jgi:HAD superfamily hydrolase (TIGR01509 family)
MSERAPLVIFDCDGVLVETERVDVQVDREIFRELGWDLTIEEVAEMFVGGTTEHFRITVENHFGAPLGFDWEERYGDRYHSAYAEQLTAVDGVAVLLNSLKHERCVASNATPGHVRSVLDFTGLAKHFGSRIFTASEVARGKPAPDIFLHAAASLRYSPSECVVIEDSVPGVRAARAAGMRVFGYAGGLTPGYRLEPHCEAVFSSMSELEPLLNANEF